MKNKIKIIVFSVKKPSKTEKLTFNELCNDFRYNVSRKDWNFKIIRPSRCSVLLRIKKANVEKYFSIPLGCWFWIWASSEGREEKCYRLLNQARKEKKNTYRVFLRSWIWNWSKSEEQKMLRTFFGPEVIIRLG